jgi:FkbM family methyltransferase
VSFFTLKKFLLSNGIGLIKKINVLRFFRFDSSFFYKLNIEIVSLYDSCKKNKIKYLSHNQKEGKIYFKYNERYTLVSDYSVATIVQIFAYRNYDFTLPESENGYLVFDIGMNKGYSSMWFAMQQNIKMVIGYEVNDELSEYIDENRILNNLLFHKIKSNTFGLAGKSEEATLRYLKNDDGVSTIREDFYLKYWSEERKHGVREKKVKVKEASSEINKYLKEFPNSNYILKIDVEGSEYEIISNLAEKKLLNKFDIILGETHSGFKDIEKHLDSFTIENLENFAGDLNTFVAFNKKYKERK